MHMAQVHLCDMYEIRAIKNTFGDAANQLKVSSTKSMTGHLLGATGGFRGYLLSIIYS